MRDRNKKATTHAGGLRIPKTLRKVVASGDRLAKAIQLQARILPDFGQAGKQAESVRKISKISGPA